MSVVDLATVEARAAARMRRPCDGASVTSALRCLVLSVDGLRRGDFIKAVSTAGWDAVSCSDVKAARETVRRETFQLTFLDLESASRDVANVYRECGERLTTDSDGLLVICGQRADPMEEVWARKIGTWFYLPGVVSWEVVGMLCNEAKLIVEKKARQEKQDMSARLMT